MTLGEAQRLAALRSRQLAGIDAAVAASREMAVAAGQRPDPVLKFGVENLPVSGDDKFSLTRDFMTMRRIGVMQELTRSDKRHWRAEGFSRAADKAASQKNLALAAIERDTAIAWLERYYAQEMASQITGLADQEKLEIDAAEGAYRGGRGSLADILAARTALAMVGDRASEAGRRVRNAKTMLARWTGAGADVPLAGQPPIDALRLEPGQLEALIANHPRLAVMAKQEGVAQAEAKLAEADKKVDWTVEVAFLQRGPDYSNMASVGVSVPLQWNQRNRQDRELAAKLAAVEQARAEREETQRMLAAEIRTMIEEWTNGRERIARFERELLPLARDRTQAVLSAYRGGKATLSDVLAARRNETEVRLQELQLRLDTARVWAALNYIFPISDSSTGALQAPGKAHHE
ncbi:TolC family protein [Massilia glaciei]|uniref:TolC family protein n=3 Tax=Pseudomonadati TaxID=3379134 RepID=A0A2U2HLR9_9BURK|nr:TolC family protein [Massilia glaciei]